MAASEVVCKTVSAFVLSTTYLHGQWRESIRKLMTNIVPDTHVEYNVCVSELLPDHYDDKTTTESKSE